MMSRLGALLLLCTLTCGAALAQAPAAKESAQASREQVLKLMSAMGMDRAVESSLRDAQKQLKDAARASFQKANPNADDATLKKLDEVFDSTPMFKFEDIADAVVPVYQRNLSAADVQAGIDFYSSESGKRLLEKVPVILREANEQGGQLVQTKMEAYSDELARKLDSFEAQVNPKKAPEAPPASPSGDASKPTDDKSPQDDKSK